MKSRAFCVVALAATIFGGSLSIYGQGEHSSKPATDRAVNGAAASPANTATTSPMDLARAARAAQGGEKFKAVQNMVLRGSVDLYAPNSTQSIPGSFVMVNAGDKLRIEI